MALQITNSFVRQYESDVHDEFQRRGTKLLSTIRWKSEVVGTSTTFQKIGTGTATTKSRHGTITPMNQDHTAIVCTLSDFYAGDFVDKLDESKINIDERQAIARGGANAIGRKVDDQIITILNSTTQATQAWVLTSAATIRASLVEMVEALDANDVDDDGDRWGLLTPRAWSQALMVNEFSSADFVGADLPFVKRTQARSWMGVNWMRHTGLPGVATTTANVYVYHKMSTGYASAAHGGGNSDNGPIVSDITWHGDRASHFVNNMMSGGSCLIDDLGVIEGSLNDTTDIVTT